MAALRRSWALCPLCSEPWPRSGQESLGRAALQGLEQSLLPASEIPADGNAKKLLRHGQGDTLRPGTDRGPIEWLRPSRCAENYRPLQPSTFMAAIPGRPTLFAPASSTAEFRLAARWSHAALALPGFARSARLPNCFKAPASSSSPAESVWLRDCRRVAFPPA